MDKGSWLKAAVTLVFMALLINELVKVAVKIYDKESFQVVNELVFERLDLPSVTICPGLAYRKPGPFTSKTDFEQATFGLADIFSPMTIENIHNASTFRWKSTYAYYYGVCYTLQFLGKQQIFDYTYDLRVKKSMDYFFYLHEPMEEEFLLFGVFPYTYSIGHLDAHNEDDFGGADIVVEKSISEKIPSKSGCKKDWSIRQNINCLRKEVSLRLSAMHLKCKIPMLEFTDYNPPGLKYCANKTDSQGVEKVVFEAITELQNSQFCEVPCRRTSYNYNIHLQSAKTIANDPFLGREGSEYFVIWIYYSSLYVDEKIEKYLFGLDTALASIGGSMGLLLGWSCHSIIIKCIDCLLHWPFKNK